MEADGPLSPDEGGAAAASFVARRNNDARRRRSSPVPPHTANSEKNSVCRRLSKYRPQMKSQRHFQSTTSMPEMLLVTATGGSLCPGSEGRCYSDAASDIHLIN